ncbi:MAG: dTMP kinase [Treponema sp.]|jgi:dTMP kinase|nr:dTMP kinase [Treponema sp.]
MDIIQNFVVFEGADGSGTTTQLNMLADRFTKTSKTAFFPTFEPTGGAIGKLIRSALKNEAVFDPKALCYLFAADRVEHLFSNNGILERTNRGEFVVSDRYSISSLVYQGIECGDELPAELNKDFPAPEITIFFDLKPDIAKERMKARTSLEIYEYLEFQNKVYAKYLAVLEKYAALGARVEIIDASEPAEIVHDKVWSILSQMPIFKI